MKPLNPLARTELTGHFVSFVAVNAKTGARRHLAGHSGNLILDTGLDYFCGGVGQFNAFCMVGSGSGTPVVSQTALLTLVASTTTVTSSTTGTDLVNNYAYSRKTYRFGLGAAAGNLSEVAVGWAASNAFCRARIVDNTNTPTTITVLSDEYLDVTYELRAYWPLSDFTGTITLDGVSTSITGRAAIVGSWQNYLGDTGTNLYTIFGVGCYDNATNASNIGAITASVPGSQNGAAPVAYDGTYVTGSFERKYQVTCIPSGLSSGFSSPITAIGGMQFTVPWGVYKAAFNPPIAKTDTKTLNLKFKHMFARRTL